MGESPKQASTSETRNSGVAVLGLMSGFIDVPSFLSVVDPCDCQGLKERKKAERGRFLTQPRIQIFFWRGVWKKSRQLVKPKT
jgi:hypothetical protein